MRLDKSKFIKWLNTKQPDEIVGHNHDCHTCPIANFYNEVSGGYEIVIFDDIYGRYVADRGNYKKRLPDWGQDFASSVDGEGRSARITAKRALELLA